MSENPIVNSALILAVAIVIFGFVIRPETKIVEKDTEEYRYQWVRNDSYSREGVFDRKYGIFYCMGSNEKLDASASNYSTGEIYWKKREDKKWDKDFMIQSEAKIIWVDGEK